MALYNAVLDAQEHKIYMSTVLIWYAQIQEWQNIVQKWVPFDHTPWKWASGGNVKLALAANKQRWHI
jgi:hypothetical protein